MMRVSRRKDTLLEQEFEKLPGQLQYSTVACRLWPRSDRSIAHDQATTT